MIHIFIKHAAQRALLKKGRSFLFYDVPMIPRTAFLNAQAKKPYPMNEMNSRGFGNERFC